MGYYIRKAFSSGPVRLNLSKSGLGLSLGITGLRLGVGPKGTYVHAGRKGIYFRKFLGTGKKNYRSTARHQSTSQDNTDPLAFVKIIGGIIALIILVNVINFLAKNPGLVILILISAALVGGVFLYSKYSKSKTIKDYQEILEQVFILGTAEFNKENLRGIKDKLVNSNCKSEADKIEKNIYHATLDKIIDDNQITSAEKKIIQELESIIGIDDSYKKQAKVELFKSYYLNAIEDRLITDLEINTLNNIAEGLGIDQNVIKEEMKIVQEIIRMQKLKYPLTPLTTVPITIQKGETAYYSARGKILTKRKAPKNSNYEYEYVVQREGNLVITNKRILLVKDGTTSIYISDVLDIDVDLDNKVLHISKGTSVTPTIIQTEEILFCGKIIDILRNNIGL